MTENASETAAGLLGIGLTPTADDFDPSPYLPPGCDLVELTREHVQRALDRNTDPTVVTLGIGRVNGTKVQHLGTFAAAGATLAALAASFGAGIYEVRYKNASGSYVGARRVTVDSNGATLGAPPFPGTLPPSSQAFPPVGGAPPWGAPPPAWGAQPWGYPPRWNGQQQQQLSPLELLAMRMIERSGIGNGQNEDPMRGSMAKILEMIALGAEQQRQFLQTVTQLQMTQRDAAAPATDKAFDLLTKLLLAERTKPQPPTQAEQTIELLKLGAMFAARANGVETDEKEDSWVDLIRPGIESLGPGAVTLLAQAFLPPEKAKVVSDTVSDHMKAREAEARADAAVDTTGTEV